MACNRHFMNRQRFGQRPRAVAVLGLAVALIGGCATESSATPTDVATNVPTATGRQTEEPSPDATSTESAAAPSPDATTTESAAATIPADADLATLLPTTLADAQVSIARFDGDDLTEVPRSENQSSDQDPFGNFVPLGGIAALAEELDVLPAEVLGAMAYAPDHEPDFYPHAVIAVRVAGADPAAMVDALALAIGGARVLSGELTVTEETVGGKTVSVIESSNSHYFYAIGDVAFIVKIDDPGEAEEVLRELP